MMTYEEMQQTMQFILEQQAQFAVNMQRLEESPRQAEERVKQLEGATVGVVNILHRITLSQQRLTEAQEHLAEAQKQTDATVAELAQAQKQTDERLNALINMVERYLGGRRHENSKD